MTRCKRCLGTGFVFSDGGFSKRNSLGLTGRSRSHACSDCDGTGTVKTKRPSRSRSTSVSLADELSKLAQLRDNGVLTELEFQQAKRKLLDQ
jgi:hypothetical protein